LWRRALGTVAAVLAASAAAACGDTGRHAALAGPVAPDVAAAGEGTLRVELADGISLGAVADAFTAATGCRVVSESAGQGADLVANAPIAGADVYALSGEDLLALVSRGATSPVVTDAVPGYSSIIAPLRDGDVARRNNLIFGVPFTWGPDQIYFAPGSGGGASSSWADLYDPALAGSVAMRDSPFTLAMAALVLGADDPFALTREDLDAAAALTARERRSLRAYWRQPDDLALLFANHEVSLAAGTGPTARLPIGADAVVPLGVGTAWSDWWAVASSPAHPRCAYKWLAYTLSPAPQITLAEQNAGAPVSQDACPLMAAAACAATHDTDKPFLARMRFARTPDGPTSLADWQDAWARSR
jgi:putative spermidine/putrescine transport system substrate-binding protein